MHLGVGAPPLCKLALEINCNCRKLQSSRAVTQSLLRLCPVMIQFCGHSRGCIFMLFVNCHVKSLFIPFDALQLSSTVPLVLMQFHRVRKIWSELKIKMGWGEGHFMHQCALKFYHNNTNQMSDCKLSIPNDK